MAEKIRNNSSWCCDRIEELIEDYKKRKDKCYDSEIRQQAYEMIIEELEEILYCN